MEGGSALVLLSSLEPNAVEDPDAAGGLGQRQMRPHVGDGVSVSFLRLRRQRSQYGLPRFGHLQDHLYHARRRLFSQGAWMIDRSYSPINDYFKRLTPDTTTFLLKFGLLFFFSGLVRSKQKAFRVVKGFFVSC